MLKLLCRSCGHGDIDGEATYRHLLQAIKHVDGEGVDSCDSNSSTLTSNTVGHGIRKVDGRVCGDLHGEVGDHFIHHSICYLSTHFTDPRASEKEGTVSTCRTISGRGTVLL